MSTKNLARTVIEGGRTTASKYHRRSSLQWMRAGTRALCRKLAADPELAEKALFPKRDREYDDIEHADRTSPCERFLISRAGLRWDDVRSEIISRFDTRSLAGRHVVYEHLLNRVVTREEVHRIRYWWRLEPPKFYVDADGVLRHNPSSRW